MDRLLLYHTYRVIRSHPVYLVICYVHEMYFLILRSDNYYQVNFPADDLGKTCFNELKEYPYMFFDNPADTTQGRYCLKACPKAGEMIQCQNNGTVGANCRPKASSYNTKAEINKIGAFCSPTDESTRLKLFSQ